ncbi:hypothetical protein [Bradyrhizobium sp.]|uniref:hypothetical protein n=1 Tax=Bradyrhizobium sp. TaxID=376 RepID=UPI002DFD2D6C|nr:hypothetical protein [Bradyrhizobium sp.]
MAGFTFWRPNFAFPFPNASSGLLYYSDDLTHLLFTACLIVEVYLGNLLFDRIESFTADLRRAGCRISREEQVAIRALNQRFRRLFRSPGWSTFSLPRVVIRLFAIVAGVSVFLFFFSKVQQPCGVSAKCWWGQSGSGVAGTYYSLAIGGLVYLATEALAAILVGMSMINFILRDGYAKPNLFAQDLANGMSPVGDLVLTSFFISLVGAVAIFIVLRLGYFGVEDLIVIWGLIIAATLYIPLATLIPMYSAVRLISECKRALLQSINTMFHSGVSDVTHSYDMAQIREIQPALGFYKHVSELNVFPFEKYKALVSVITLTFVVAQTIYNFIKLFQ